MLTSSSTRLGRSARKSSTPFSPVSAVIGSNFIARTIVASVVTMVRESSTMRIFGKRDPAPVDSRPRLAAGLAELCLQVRVLQRLGDLGREALHDRRRDAGGP